MKWQILPPCSVFFFFQIACSLVVCLSTTSIYFLKMLLKYNATLDVALTKFGCDIKYYITILKTVNFLKSVQVLSTFMSGISTMPATRQKYNSHLLLSPACCGSVDWALAYELKGHWFVSQSGHMPVLRTGSLVREDGRGNPPTFVPLFLLPSPLSKKK